MIHTSHFTVHGMRFGRGLLLGGMMLVVLVSLFSAQTAQAWVPGQPIIPQCSISQYNQTGGLIGITNPCGWRDLATLAGNVFQFMLFLAVPIAAVVFAYAGLLYFTSRGSPEQIKKAHGLFTNVFWGLIIVLAAWALVDLIVKGLVVENAYIPFLEEPEE